MSDFQPEKGKHVVPDFLDCGTTTSVFIDPASSEFYVRATCEAMIAGLAQWGGFSSDVNHSVYSLLKAPNVARQYHRAYPATAAAEDSLIKLLPPLAAFPIDLYTQEGLALIARCLAASRGVVTVHARKPNSQSDLHALMELKQRVLERCYAAVFFFSGAVGCQGDELAYVFENTLIVRAAQPSPDMELAYAVEWTPQSALATSGRKAQLQQLRTEPNGIVVGNCEPFTALDYVSRQAYAMRLNGKSLEEIGRALGRDKSTISRRLDAMPAVRRMKAHQDFE